MYQEQFAYSVCLPVASHTIQTASFYALWTLILLSKFGSTSYILLFDLSMLVECLQGYLLRENFFQSLALGHPHLFHHSHLTSTDSPSRSSSGCILRLEWPQCQQPHSQLSIYVVHLCSAQILLSVLPLFILWCIFLSAGQSSLLIIHFCEISHGFITRRQGGSSACVWPQQQIGSDQYPTDKLCKK